MISVRNIQKNDLVKLRTEITFKVQEIERLFQGNEIKMAIYQVTLASTHTKRVYAFWYYEDGHTVEPYNYCKDIMSFWRP